jgi:hypothetical protein
MICDHNEKLASHDRKKIKNFVMLIFLFFGAEPLGIFFCKYNILTNGFKYTTKKCQYI